MKDILFLGNNYSPYRTDLARFIKMLPFETAVWGRGYPENISDGDSLYDFKKTGKLYRGARIGVADNQFAEARGFFSDRAFMIMASGGCLLMHQEVEGMEELAGLIDGVHYVAWKDKADLARKADYYLNNEPERQRIADAGTIEFHKNHTYARRVDQLKTIIEKLPKLRQKVSAMMIVKNERAHIERCIANLDWADEIVIVDTGSIDGTAECLQLLVSDEIHPDGAVVPYTGKVKYFEYEWKDDFSAARNFAKGKCTGDWVFWMDADDLLPERTVASLRKFPWSGRKMGISNPGAHKMMCVEYRDGMPVGQTLQTRLFRNIPMVQWRDPIHETVDASLKELGLSVVGWRKLEIQHIGTIDPAIQEMKQKRNIAILRNMNHSPWKFMQIGSSFAAVGRWGDAILFFQQAQKMTKDKEFQDFIHFGIGKAYYESGFKELATESLDKSDFPDAVFLRATIKEKDGQFPFEDYRTIVKAEFPTEFPSSLMTDQDIARAKLIEWYAKELKSLMG